MQAAKDVCSYGPSTGVTRYWKHLASIAEWVTTCEKAKIKIDADMPKGCGCDCK